MVLLTKRVARYERFLNYFSRLKNATRFSRYSRIQKASTSENTASYSNKYYTEAENVGVIVIIEANIYYKNLFFVITIIAIKSIELTAHNEKYTFITNTFIYLVISEIDYS